MAEIVGHRLEQLIQDRRTSQSEIARALGVSQPTIGRLISGETKETGKILELAKALSTSPEYLVGETDISEPLGAADRAALLSFDRANSDTVQLDQIDLRYGLGATYFDAPVSVEKRSFSKDWLQSITRTAPEFLFWAIGDGDSMEPTIRSGEILLIDRSRTTPRMGEGIWALAWGDVGMIKRVRPLPDGSIELHSDNGVISPIVASDGEVSVVGRVIAVVRRL